MGEITIRQRQADFCAEPRMGGFLPGGSRTAFEERQFSLLVCRTNVTSPQGHSVALGRVWWWAKNWAQSAAVQFDGVLSAEFGLHLSMPTTLQAPSSSLRTQIAQLREAKPAEMGLDVEIGFSASCASTTSGSNVLLRITAVQISRDIAILDNVSC